MGKSDSINYNGNSNVSYFGVRFERSETFSLIVPGFHFVSPINSTRLVMKLLQCFENC